MLLISIEIINVEILIRMKNMKKEKIWVYFELSFEIIAFIFILRPLSLMLSQKSELSS